jgi:uncharacterized protein
MTVVVTCAATAAVASEAAFQRGRATISTQDGRRIALRVEIARTPAEWARGLSGRTTLARNAGMLFVYPRAARRSFWMRNTHIPLEIAFLDARGRIRRTLRMEPCHADPCRLYNAGFAFRSALEVNAGSFARWRVRRGDVVRLVGR